MKGKRVVIFGVANHHSLAWAIAQQLHKEGAELAFNFLGEKLEKRVRPLAEEVNAKYIADCDVTNDTQVEAFYAGLKKVWPQIDGIVHSVAFAPAEALMNRFIECSREGYRTALEVSAYSLNVILKRAEPMMAEGGGAIALTYHGSTKIITNYHIMGVAKAALECGIRYLSAELGASKKFRVNGISAGPVRTLASSGIKNFRGILSAVEQITPLRRNILPEEVGKAALYLLSDLSSGVTGEIHYVDCGLNLIGLNTAAQGGEAPKEA